MMCEMTEFKLPIIGNSIRKTLQDKKKIYVTMIVNFQLISRFSRTL